MGGEGFLLVEKLASEGPPSFGGLALFLDVYCMGITQYIMPPHFLQHHDFKGLTCKLFRNMDLRSIFGLNSRFGVVWEGFVFSHRFRSHSLNSSVYQRVTGRCGFSDLLEDSAPALPDIGRSAIIDHCRIG
jgi:hypothetical protein